MEWLTTAPPPVIPITALVVSAFALYFAAKNYGRKAGILVRGSFGTCSSVDCDDVYVASVVLENLKDRAVTIFGIYLQVGHNYYIDVEGFEQNPLVLKPFETWKGEYGPIEMYAVSSTRVHINDLLQDRKVRKRLVLSTTDGRYIVPASIRGWNPIGEMFKNVFAGVLRPVRNEFKGQPLGGNIRFVLEITHHNGREEIIPIREADYQVSRFRHFRLTKESLSSKAALEQFLADVVIENKLNCKQFKVHDLNSWRETELKFYRNGSLPHTAEPRGWFTYFVVGRLLSFKDDMRLRKQNREIQARARKKKTEKPLPPTEPKSLEIDGDKATQE